MKKLSEGRKMWLSMMALFIAYATIFILLEDYDRHGKDLFTEASDWHLLCFSLVALVALGVTLYRYAHRMDERIIRDQDEKRNEMRRQMTQNISHELKTPVASIMGLTETILDNPQLDNDQRHEFVRRTHAQAQRLSHLLQDISTLNRLDYASSQLEHTQVDVSQVVADILFESLPACRQHLIEVHNELPDILVINGNQQLLYSIFRNLMDNALNYAGDGAIVSIGATEGIRHWHFTFSDTGHGVANEHLPHLFERFYRVDKGRSRAMGGTGLGLAIVKNAVLYHRGTIKAIKNQTGGLTIEFTLHK